MPAPAPLTTIVTATLAGNEHTNQDHILLTPHAVAVLDGATSWPLSTDQARDGGWYARTLAATLSCHLEDTTRPLADLVAQAIADLRQSYQLRPGTCPSSEDLERGCPSHSLKAMHADRSRRAPDV